MRTLSLLLIVALASCAPRVVPVARVPTAPVRAQAVAPQVARVQAQAARADRLASKLASKVDALQRDATNAHATAAHALAMADTLRKQGSATQRQLDDAWHNVSNLTALNASLERSARDAFASAEQHEAARVRVANELAKINAAAAAKDAEAATLQAQHGDMSATIDAQNQEYAAQAKQLTKAQQGAAVGGFLRGWILAGVIAIAAFFGLRLFLTTLKPL